MKINLKKYQNSIAYFVPIIILSFFSFSLFCQKEIILLKIVYSIVLGMLLTTIMSIIYVIIMFMVGKLMKEQSLEKNYINFDNKYFLSAIILSAVIWGIVNINNNSKISSLKVCMDEYEEEYSEVYNPRELLEFCEEFLKE